jgi:serine/threonine protein kinase
MAVVYKAWDTRSSVMSPQNHSYGDVPLPYFTILQRLSEKPGPRRISHPNIVNIFDYGEHESAPFLVMEYLAGGT